MPTPPTSDFSMSHIYRSMSPETIAKLPTDKSRDALLSVKTVKLDVFRTKVRTLETSEIFDCLVHRELMMTQVFEGAPKYSEYENTMVAAAAHLAMTLEINRRIPVPK